MPKSWLALSQADLIIISKDELEGFQISEPERFQALATWFVFGGRMIVYGCREEQDRVDTLDLLYSVSNRPTESRPQKRWEPVELTGDYADSNIDAISSLGWGRISMLASDLSTFTSDDWERVFNQLGERHENRSDVVGTNALNHMPRNGYTIERIGEAPILLFVVMLSLFVVGVGPVLCYFLNRIGQSTWLLAAIPGISALATILVLSSVMFTEGFRTRMSVNSATLIEPETGLRWTSSHCAIYAPYGRTRFDQQGDLVLMPGTNRNLKFHVSSRGEYWTGEDLRARQHFQMVVTEIQPADQTVSIVNDSNEAASDNPTRAAVNRLNVRIEALLGRKGDKYYFAKSIEPGDRSTLTLIEPLVVSDTGGVQPIPSGSPEDAQMIPIRKDLVRAMGLDPEARAASMQATRWLGLSTANELTTNDSIGLVDRDFQMLIKQMIPPLEADEYLCIVREIPFGVPIYPNARVEKQLHFIHGRW